MALLGEVDDGQPAVAEGYTGLGIDPGADVVGAAVTQRVGHSFGGASQIVSAGLAASVEEPGYPAHGQSVGSSQPEPGLPQETIVHVRRIEGVAPVEEPLVVEEDRIAGAKADRHGQPPGDHALLKE